NADALRRISLAWHSSRTSRSKALIRACSSVVSPGRSPLSRSARRTHVRSVSALQPIFPVTDVIAAHWELELKGTEGIKLLKGTEGIKTPSGTRATAGTSFPPRSRWAVEAAAVHAVAGSRAGPALSPPSPGNGARQARAPVPCRPGF